MNNEWRGFANWFPLCLHVDSLFIDQSIYPSSEGLSFIWMKSIGNQIILSDGLDSFPVASIPIAIGAICININISSYTRPILHPALHAPRLSCVCLILLWGTIKLLLLLLVFDQSSLLFNSLPVYCWVDPYPHMLLLVYVGVSTVLRLISKVNRSHWI